MVSNSLSYMGRLQGVTMAMAREADPRLAEIGAKTMKLTQTRASRLLSPASLGYKYILPGLPQRTRCMTVIRQQPYQERLY